MEVCGVDLETLIGEAFGADAAKAWAKFSPTSKTVDAISEAGQQLLMDFPTMPGAGVMLSALCVRQLEKLKVGPTYVVAGSLYLRGQDYVGDKLVFGKPGKLDGQAKFSSSDLAWDGHVWIVCGDRLVDVSLFRTAYSRFSPPALAAHIRKKIGEERDLMICKLEDVAVYYGLRYETQYVLKQDQVDAVARGAIHRAQSYGAGASPIA
jgi:hypothetical protein